MCRPLKFQVTMTNCRFLKEQKSLKKHKYELFWKFSNSYHIISNNISCSVFIHILINSNYFFTILMCITAERMINNAIYNGQLPLNYPNVGYVLKSLVVKKKIRSISSKTSLLPSLHMSSVCI